MGTSRTIQMKTVDDREKNRAEWSEIAEECLKTAEFVHLFK
jgi:hypothetical protein